MTEVKAPEPQKQPEKADSKVEKPVFTRPTSQLDIEARLKVGNRVEPRGETVNPSAPDDSGFIATDPIYQNRANETEMPYEADGGADALAEEAHAKSFEKPKHPKPAAEKS